MDWVAKHKDLPHASFHGGDMDCGNGLLLLIRKHLGPLEPGQLLEILSTEVSVDEDLPAWARLTGNVLVSRTIEGKTRSFLIRKAQGTKSTPNTEPHASVPNLSAALAHTRINTLPDFCVTGIGSWPRPGWMLQAIHNRLENRLGENEFQATADDAVRLVVQAQLQAGANLITDGEQRRDSYASFIGSRLGNCQLVPIVDLLPYVDDPEKFKKELESLDVPGESIHHPAVFGPISREKPLVAHELRFLQTLTEKPCKVALPGPYLLTRTLWLECVSEKVYKQREDLANDVIRILREEIEELLRLNPAVIQLDEPVLTDIVFGRPSKQRSFMCGALGEKKAPAEELEFASECLRRTLEGFPREKFALHICRGNWSRDEAVALAGDYRPLLGLLKHVPVGILYLEMCTPRAGEMEVLAGLDSDFKLGLGVVNPKREQAESVQEILSRAEHAIDLFGPKRVMLNPDCGFATFADSPISSREIAMQKISNMAAAAKILREKYP
jgi:5-methyltetrahydropteroyltriglutamate--homocysteine methyltransferase